MKTKYARAATYTVVALLAVIAIRFNPPITPRAPIPAIAAAESVALRPLPSLWHSRSDTLERGETLSELLQHIGVAPLVAASAIRAASDIDERRVQPGLAVTVSSHGDDSLPAEITFKLAIDRLLHVRRTSDGWVASEEKLPWTTDTVVVQGTIASTLYDALDSAAAGVLPKDSREALAWTLADIYEYKIDMSRDLQEGDGFRALVERQRGPGGATRIGNVLAASFTLSGTEMDAVRFHSASVSGDYFDQNGKSMRAAFLRAPLQFRRISSVFGRRYHPILKTWRNHTGTDYAAAEGTPVRAISDGVVIFAGRKGGYGNCIDIRHRNGYISRYGHLHGFAKGIHTGSRVSIGQTIAYVGMTGLATGPHLHFEIRVHGHAEDPRVALRMKGGDPIPAGERARFDSVKDGLLAELEGTPGPVRFAQR